MMPHSSSGGSIPRRSVSQCPVYWIIPAHRALCVIAAPLFAQHSPECVTKHHPTLLFAKHSRESSATEPSQPCIRAIFPGMRYGGGWTLRRATPTSCLRRAFGRSHGILPGPASRCGRGIPPLQPPRNRAIRPAWCSSYCRRPLPDSTPRFAATRYG